MNPVAFMSSVLWISLVLNNLIRGGNEMHPFHIPLQTERNGRLSRKGPEGFVYNHPNVYRPMRLGESWPTWTQVSD